MQFSGPIAKDAWKSDESLRYWFEIAIDFAFNPEQHRAYICKNCWQIFSADEDLWTVQNHLLTHEKHGDKPYDEFRPSRVLTGEQLMHLYMKLLEGFETVLPGAGTWKFRCRTCQKRFPHRTDHLELLGHFRTCDGGRQNGLIQ